MASVGDLSSQSLPVRFRTGRLGVWMVASEVSPWAKTGGLADVVGSLPQALERLGHQITTIFPKYRGVALPDAVKVRLDLDLGQFSQEVVCHVHSLSLNRRVVGIDAPRLFDRDGHYGVRGVDFPDNAERFSVLAAAALAFAERDPAGWPVDVIHAHDWQAGLTPTLLRTMPAKYARSRNAGLVFTIHNLAYQGLFERDIVSAIGLPWSAFRIETGEFWGRFGFLKAGLEYSDYLTTVSPTYAVESQTAANGAGMDGVLKARADRYVGILNGIDTDIWDPATDPLLPARYTAQSLGGKTVCKRALLAHFGLPVGDDALARPVVAMVSRLVEQKGLDLIQLASASLVEFDATWIFLGTGDPVFEAFLREFAASHPSRVAVHIGFDESLAHLVEAGSDLFLMPSKFEPCGLNQMYSLRYGTPPVVTAVGGLEDTIQPYTARARRANGFKFKPPTPEMLVRALRQALRLFRDKVAWERLIQNGMAADHSWETSAREYGRVYRRARHAAAMRAGE